MRLLSVALGLIVLPAVALGEVAGHLYSKEGRVEYRAPGASIWSNIDSGAEFAVSSTVRTGQASRAALLMKDGVMVRLNENSTFEFGRSVGGDQVTVHQGIAHFLSRQPRSFPTIKTPLVTASLRGTEFTVASIAGETQITVLQGSLAAENSEGLVQVTDGEEVIARAGLRLQKRLLARPLDAVHWALHYPVTFDIDDFPDFVAAARHRAAGLSALRSGDLQRAVAEFAGREPIDLFARGFVAFRAGDVELALQLLNAMPVTAVPNSRALLQAGALLSRGQVDRANDLHAEVAARLAVSTPAAETIAIERLLRSQQAIIALVQNRMADAKSIAERHLKQPSASTTFVTLSYIYQAEFNLEEALAVVEQGLVKYPGSGRLRARHAELLLSFGRSAQALEEAERSIAALPFDPYPLSLAGFASLALNDTDKARHMFGAAIGLSDGLGLPFLGLGLTRIREGQLAEGRRLIQQAAHLEPATALYRSYLGKAFFEEEEAKLAEEEYRLAIRLDPHDPTPYLYRAFNSLSLNRPIEALRDLERSVDLNDNRAVYRSRLLLDQDRGVRSTSLAEVYSRLGFSQIAQTEAIKSLGRDYANYSAHLLLAKSYETDDLIQAAISESYIARLLSPVNFNLVRPSQGGSVSANEYSTLFDRAQNRLAVEGFARTFDHLIRPRTVFSGTSGKTGYAMTHKTDYADGFRDNDRYVEHETYASLQHEVTPDDTLLLDATTNFVDRGDSDVGFEPRSNDPDLTLHINDYVLRAGGNHRFGPGSRLIGQLLGHNSSLTFRDSTADRIVIINSLSQGELIDQSLFFGQSVQDIQFRSRGIRGDLQHIYDSPQFSAVTGTGVLESSNHLSDDAPTSFDEEIADLHIFTHSENTEASRRFYHYTTLHLLPWLDLQGGLSFAHLRLSGAPLSVPASEATETTRRWLPKAGLVLSLPSETTVRAAFFENIGNSGVRELEVIEPTIIGGFNQSFYDFFPGTRSRNIAVGIDQKFESETFVGVQALRRHIIQHFPVTYDLLELDADSGDLIGSAILAGDDPDDHVDEDVFKGYLYQVLGDRTSATLDYSHIRNEDSTEVDEALTRTDKVKLGVNYFDPSGLFLFTAATWRQQDLSGFDEGSEAANGNRDFWLVDAGIGYRLAKRRGEITLAATNIFDQEYRYLAPESDILIFPGFGARLQFSYNFEP